jgi:hypothetical protein
VTCHHTGGRFPRRRARRGIGRAYFSALPAGCVSAPQGGVDYQNCGGVYYRAAFQGNNLVYVVQ